MGKCQIGDGHDYARYCQEEHEPRQQQDLVICPGTPLRQFGAPPCQIRAGCCEPFHVLILVMVVTRSIKHV